MFRVWAETRKTVSRRVVVAVDYEPDNDPEDAQERNCGEETQPTTRLITGLPGLFLLGHRVPSLPGVSFKDLRNCFLRRNYPDQVQGSYLSAGITQLS
jgi:hypothetical protein